MGISILNFDPHVHKIEVPDEAGIHGQLQHVNNSYDIHCWLQERSQYNVCNVPDHCQFIYICKPFYDLKHFEYDAATILVTLLLIVNFILTVYACEWFRMAITAETCHNTM
jgi:hypothetical protein